LNYEQILGIKKEKELLVWECNYTLFDVIAIILEEELANSSMS
jgi:hypothetical protein